MNAQLEVGAYQERSFSDYLKAVKRRKGVAILVAMAVFLAGAVLAFGLPPIYRSSAIILIEQQEIPQDLVRSTVTSYADQRIQVISQRVMTTSNLWGIVEKYDLYAEERQDEPREVIIAGMRNDISMDTLSADVVDPRSGRPMEATIAFTVAYENRSPKLAQQVANELTSLYLNENLKSREQAAEETAAFLADEATRLQRQIDELEVRLADFKEANVGRLPELTEMNISLMNRTENEIREVEREIQNLVERKIYLEAELAQIEPDATLYSETGERVLSAAGRLRVAENEYMRLSSVYSEDHPDIKRLKREIEALRAETGLASDPADIAARLEGARADLAAAREKYAADHPDVRRLDATVERLTRELDAARAVPSTGDAAVDTLRASNPAYIQLNTQLEAANSQLAALKRKQSELRAKLTEYEQRLTDMPQVEREYRGIAREYDNAVRKYREIRAKQMEAQLARSLESERKGERFTLIEPPLMPEEPVKPNRTMILVLAAILAVGGAIGLVVLLDAMDDTIRGKRALATLAGAPPLAVIPYITTDAEKRRRRRAIAFSAAGTFAGFVLLLVVVHFAYRPLDILWFVAARRLGM